MAKSIFLGLRQHMTRPGRNYQVNELECFVGCGFIKVEGICRNEYGGGYSNRDAQVISASVLPNWLWNKLAEYVGKYFTIYDDDTIDFGFAYARELTQEAQ